MKISNKSIFWGMVTLLSFTFATAKESIILREEITVPTCYEKSNTAIIRGLELAELRATQECKEGTAEFQIPVTLLQVKIDINTPEQNRACGNVIVKAKYLCIK